MLTVFNLKNSTTYNTEYALEVVDYLNKDSAPEDWKYRLVEGNAEKNTSVIEVLDEKGESLGYL